MENTEFDKATYNIAETARILNVNGSCVRTWIKSFPDIFNIDFDGKRKELTKNDVDKLKYIKELRGQGLNLKQIENHYKNNDKNSNDRENFARDLFSLFSIELFSQINDLDISNKNHLKELYIEIYDSLSIKLNEIEAKLNEIKNEKIKINNMLLEQNKINEERYKTIEELLLKLNAPAPKRGLFNKKK